MNHRLCWGYKSRGRRRECPTRFRRRERILGVEAPQPRQHFPTISLAHSFANTTPTEPYCWPEIPESGRNGVPYGERLEVTIRPACHGLPPNGLEAAPGRPQVCPHNRYFRVAKR